MDEKDELWSMLEDLDKVESENKDLKENLDEANECVQKLKEKLKKFKERHREVNEKLKQANKEITKLKALVEEKKRIEECLNTMVQSKIDVCTKLAQEVVNLKENLEKEKPYEDNFKINSTKLEEFIVGQKTSKYKGGLGNEAGESSKDKKTLNSIDN